MSKENNPKYLTICQTELRLLNPSTEEESSGLIPIETRLLFDGDMCEVYSRIAPDKWESLVAMYNCMISQANDIFMDGLLEIGEERLGESVR